MADLVQCRNCFAFISCSTLWRFGCCQICRQFSLLQQEIAFLKSEIFKLSVKQTPAGTAAMPLPQRTPRNGRWVTVGSGRLRVVDRRQVPQSVVLQNSFAALSECKDNMDMDSSTEGEKPSTPMSNVCKTAAKDKKDKVKSQRKQLLLGESIIRSVELKENGFVRCLPGATARRDRRRIINIVKQAKQEGDVDVLVHLGTNDLACNEVSEVKKSFITLGNDVQDFASTISFSEVLPVHNVQNDRQRRIKEFNIWLSKWCQEQGFGFVSHDSSTWNRKELYKKDGLHLSLKGTNVLSEQLQEFAKEYLN